MGFCARPEIDEKEAGLSTHFLFFPVSLTISGSLYSSCYWVVSEFCWVNSDEFVASRNDCLLTLGFWLVTTFVENDLPDLVLVSWMVNVLGDL